MLTCSLFWIITPLLKRLFRRGHISKISSCMFCSSCRKKRHYQWLLHAFKLVIEKMLVKRGNPNRKTWGVFQYKKLWEIFVRNFHFGKRAFHLLQVSFVKTRGSRGSPGEIFKWITNFPLGSFHRERWEHLFGISNYSRKFLLERAKKSCTIYIPTGISGIFW